MGIIRIVLAGLISLTTMLSMALLGFWFRTIRRLRDYSIYSFIIAIMVFISGGAAVYTGTTFRPNLGLIDRITICRFLQSLFVIAAKLYTFESPEAFIAMKLL